MKILKIVIISLVAVVALTGAIFFSINYFKPKPGGIKIITTPKASVYINEKYVGKSPYEETYPAGKISLKLVPEAGNQNLISYETRLTLTSGIQTVVDREFGSNEENSSGYVTSFEKTRETDAGLVVISLPDNAQILVDGVPRGFTPYKNMAITSALHQITIKASGYADRVVNVKTLAGYRLTFYAKLSKDNSINESMSDTSTKTFIEIKKTPTGFLRVRTKPGTEGEEIAEVKPGEIYPYLGDDAETGWLEIQYQEPKAGMPSGISGWVSGDFAKKVELPTNSTTSASIK